MSGVRAGVLAIGSLLWNGEPDSQRARWRKERLDQDRGIPVQVPVGYGRLSKSRTYTMVFRAGSSGRGVIMPCKHPITSFTHLKAEARALWRAEARDQTATGISASWGCVGALFKEAHRGSEMASSWSAYFRGAAKPIPPVDDQGMLDIPWPRDASTGVDAPLDMILATSNRPAQPPPTAIEIADAWIHRGHEAYFFNNVARGIRTAEDMAIWAELEAREPPWLDDPEYQQAINLLRAEAGGDGEPVS